MSFNSLCVYLFVNFLVGTAFYRACFTYLNTHVWIAEFMCLIFFVCVQYNLCSIFFFLFLWKSHYFIFLETNVSQTQNNATFSEVYNKLNFIKTNDSRLMLWAENTSRSTAPAICSWPSLVYRHISPSLSGLQLPPLLVI